MLALLTVASLLMMDVPAEPATIREDFMARVEQCGRTPPFVPALRARTTRAMILYDAETRTIVYPLWETLSEDQRMSLFPQGAPSAPEGEAIFIDIFQRLLVAHELGHWLETIDDRSISHWDSELQANRVMVAYWRAVLGDDALVEARIGRLWAALQQQPDPVPEGHGVAEWFNSAPFDPSTYGWYQAVMVREAWDRRDETDFCGLVDQAWPRPAS